MDKKKLLSLSLFTLLSLFFLAACGDETGQSTSQPTPQPTQQATKAPQPTAAQPVTMESDVHTYDSAHFGVYFVTYQTLGRDETAKFVSVEWDCYPPDPTHNHAFFSVPVFRQDGKLSYDGHTLSLVPNAGSELVGTINADGSWSMLEKDTGLHFTFKVARDAPDSLVKKYQDAPCTLSK